MSPWYQAMEKPGGFVGVWSTKNVKPVCGGRPRTTTCIRWFAPTFWTVTCPVASGRQVCAPAETTISNESRGDFAAVAAGKPASNSPTNARRAASLSAPCACSLGPRVSCRPFPLFKIGPICFIALVSLHQCSAHQPCDARAYQLNRQILRRHLLILYSVDSNSCRRRHNTHRQPVMDSQPWEEAVVQCRCLRLCACTFFPFMEPAHDIAGLHEAHVDMGPSLVVRQTRRERQGCAHCGSLGASQSAPPEVAGGRYRLSKGGARSRRPRAAPRS